MISTTDVLVFGHSPCIQNDAIWNFELMLKFNGKQLFVVLKQDEWSGCRGFIKRVLYFIIYTKNKPILNIIAFVVVEQYDNKPWYL